MVLLHLQCPSGASLHFAVLHTAFAPAHCGRAAPVSFIKLHSYAPLFRSIAPRFTALLIATGMAYFSTAHAFTQVMHTPYAMPSLQVHWVPFHPFVATSFQYASVHPLPIILLAGSPTSAAFTLWMLMLTRTSFRKAPLSYTCIVQPPPFA
jgi:hypothetical protein